MDTIELTVLTAPEPDTTGRRIRAEMRVATPGGRELCLEVRTVGRSAADLIASLPGVGGTLTVPASAITRSKRASVMRRDVLTDDQKTRLANHRAVAAFKKARANRERKVAELNDRLMAGERKAAREALEAMTQRQFSRLAGVSLPALRALLADD